MKEIIVASILFAVAILAFIMSILSFMEKGFLFNNAFLYASEQERKGMDKKPYYRQSAVMFLLICLVFTLNGFEVIFNIDWLSYTAITIIIIAVIYAIISSIIIDKRKK
ncbi:MAG: DUF3784 domain-containing protein [Clostridia bacterium]|nr:DUF3784 domain-containing protein [Clostridia bacterium]